MLMQKCVTVDNHSFDVLQRAFDGACWSVGISRCPRQGEIEDVSETRKAIALTVLKCAAAGARDVQALKASALRCLFGKAALLHGKVCTSYQPAWRLSHTAAATAPHRQNLAAHRGR
jgi:hypothetical protein